MSKAVLLSLRPEWCEKIANGEKVIEVRKTRPKLTPPFKCYIYCTSCKSFYSIGSLRYGDDELHRIPNDELYRIPGGKIKYGISFELMAYGDDKYGPENFLNRKVIGEFVCDSFVTDRTFGHDALFNAAACLSEIDAAAYCLNDPMYGWHISQLRIYDTPMKIDCFNNMTRPPQSWCYVEELT